MGSDQASPGQSGLNEPFPLPTRLPCRRCGESIDPQELYCVACQRRNAEEFALMQARGEWNMRDQRGL